ncbi:unnamed protein product [Clonostachys rosea]|uniref:Zn(2)-C6 fungal-type domain-containing protein n=1 Tax=Bionectria ochroleuca TaxID=29856 RepID=A0ABY6UVE3_BIOOC|nr:unnamed protein product [Clonostachys rosea]
MSLEKSFQSLRRKSCGACVRSKRRCDLNEPVCSRCSMRRIECVYPQRLGVIDQPSAGSSGLDPALPQTSGYGGQYPTTVAQFSSQGTLTLPAPTSLLVDDYANMHIPAYLTPPSNPFGSVPQPLSPGMFSLVQDILREQRFSSPSDLGLVSAGSRNVPNNPLLSSTGQSSSWSNDIITGSAFQPRTEYAARLMADQPATLAQNGYNCFIHHTQANSSAVLQDALAASALQAMRNPSNAAIVRAEVMRRSRLLVSAVEAARENYLPLYSMDFLPPVQALLVYQSMRLFSVGDSALVAQAERDQESLLAWTEILDNELDLFRSAPDSWETWVRKESVRRTLVYAEMVSGVYRFLRRGWDYAKQERMASLGFSVQRALWTARTANEWTIAWNNLPRLETIMARTPRDMRDATTYDVDDLGVMLRATYFGIESMERWIGEDASALERWGLRHSGRGWRPVNPNHER